MVALAVLLPTQCVTLRGIVLADQPEHASAMIAERQIERLAAALGDPTRRRVFFMVRESNDAVSKDRVADVVGIDRRLAGFHLDKLVDQGFLTAEFKRRTGRSGPGAGRPAKHYRLAAEELTVSLPARHYDLLASLLLKAAPAESLVAPWEHGPRVPGMSGTSDMPISRKIP